MLLFSVQRRRQESLRFPRCYQGAWPVSHSWQQQRLRAHGHQVRQHRRRRDRCVGCFVHVVYACMCNCLPLCVCVCVCACVQAKKKRRKTDRPPTKFQRYAYAAIEKWLRNKEAECAAEAARMINLVSLGITGAAGRPRAPDDNRTLLQQLIDAIDKRPIAPPRRPLRGSSRDRRDRHRASAAAAAPESVRFCCVCVVCCVCILTVCPFPCTGPSAQQYAARRPGGAYCCAEGDCAHPCSCC